MLVVCAISIADHKCRLDIYYMAAYNDKQKIQNTKYKGEER